MNAKRTVGRLGVVHRRWSGLLALVALSACHSGGPSAPRDAELTDAAGRGGADRPAIDGAATADGAATEAGSPETTTTACMKAIRAQCERQAVCEGGDLSSCLAYAALCPDYYFNADSARTIAGLIACVAPLAARTCTDVVMGIFPSCYVYGHRPIGAGCAYQSQCESGICGTTAACATCGSGGLANGSACTRANNCRPGSYCQVGTCADASTIMHASEGQPCNLDGAPAVGCVGDLICHPTSLAGGAGTCTAPPRAGEPCALAGFSGNVCSAGSVCSGATGGTCLAAGDAGSTPPPLPGTACDAQNPCRAPLLCRSGTCAPLGSKSCPANAADGGAL